MKGKGWKTHYCLQLLAHQIHVTCSVCGGSPLVLEVRVPEANYRNRNTVFFETICFDCFDGNGNKGRYRTFKYIQDKGLTLCHPFPPLLADLVSSQIQESVATPEPLEPELTVEEIRAQLKKGKFEGV